jgi:hypothetical protein
VFCQTWLIQAKFAQVVEGVGWWGLLYAPTVLEGKDLHKLQSQSQLSKL